MKCMTKAVIIEAVQVSFNRDACKWEFSDLPTWLMDALDDGTVEADGSEDGLSFYVKTCYGMLHGNDEDYIAQEPDGELRVVKRESFETMYHDERDLLRYKSPWAIEYTYSAVLGRSAHL